LHQFPNPKHLLLVCEFIVLLLFCRLRLFRAGLFVVLCLSRAARFLDLFFLTTFLWQTNKRARTDGDDEDDDEEDDAEPDANADADGDGDGDGSEAEEVNDDEYDSEEEAETFSEANQKVSGLLHVGWALSFALHFRRFGSLKSSQ
jgi:hypothetical protein